MRVNRARRNERCAGSSGRTTAAVNSTDGSLRFVFVLAVGQTVAAVVNFAAFCQSSRFARDVHELTDRSPNGRIGAYISLRFRSLVFLQIRFESSAH